MGLYSRPYSMELNARQEADKSTITTSTKFSALMAGRNTWCRTAQERWPCYHGNSYRLIIFSERRWAGHFNWVNNSRRSIAVFYASLCTFKKCVQNDLWKSLKYTSSKEQALDHSKWLRPVKESIAAIKGKRRKNYQKANERRLCSTV